MNIRNRRLRTNQIIRDLVSEAAIQINKIIYPIFIIDGVGVAEPISAMPGQFRLSIDESVKKIGEMRKLGINSFLLFGVTEEKDSCGSSAYRHDGLIQNAVRDIKKCYSDVIIATDVCMCGYTTHGHCGIIVDDKVDNDMTLTYLANIALSHAEAGADIVAPSDMMDGRVGVIRDVLDKNGYKDTIIMAYSVKYASSFYGPFREAANSAPGKGDRKSYQMDFRRRKEAISEVEQDIEEGADIVMVKPGLAYLDILRDVAEISNVPVAVYNVSAEYSMVKAAAEKGWIDEKNVVMEEMYAFIRAGADIIITYHAEDIGRWIAEGKNGI